MPKMKRYLVFGGMTNYAQGGINDCVEGFDTKYEAVSYAAACLARSDQSQKDDFEWWHVFDCVNHRTVAASKNQAYGADNDGLIMQDDGEQSKQLPDDGNEWRESDRICHQCRRRMWEADWWDDPPEMGGACIGAMYECGDCGYRESG